MAFVVNCYSERHEIESVSRILVVQGLKQEGGWKSRCCLINFEHQFQVRGAGFTCNSYCMRVVFMATIGFCLKVKNSCSMYCGLEIG